MSLTDEPGFLRRHRWMLTLVIVTLLASVSFVAGVANNPPGFYIDESSIAYNAHTISLTGRDEWGISWPLFFRAFGEYKNPVYIYVLAALFRLTGPSIVVARILSAVTGILAAALLGVLAARIARRSDIGILTACAALLTPWLFETGRVVMEVALYPFVITLFLFWVHRIGRKNKWSQLDVAVLAIALALLTYTYSIGRLLGPLLAFGLIVFATRERWLSVVETWGLYVLTLVPLLIFNWHNPAALSGRFQIISYIPRQDNVADVVIEFGKHFFANLNLWRLLVTGDPNPDQVVHIYGTGHMAFATVLLAGLGIFLVVRNERSNPWWKFVLFGLVASLVPASLTDDSFHMLRLVALPVFLVVLTVPALAWLLLEKGRRGRQLLFVLVVLMLLQGAVFRWQYHASARSPRRVHLFDAEYPQRILEPALARTERPVYLADALAIPGYIQAHWYATLRGLDLGVFSRLPAEAPPPLGALVISTEENCPGCEILARVEPYTLYVAHEPPRLPAPLPDSALRARIEVAEPPGILRAAQKSRVRVRVKNLGDLTWPARVRTGGRYQVSLGNHWLDSSGHLLTNDDGRSALLTDLKPGDETELSLTITAPKRKGDYLLELDMLQEEVSWFQLKGSQTVQLRVRVE